MTNRLNNQHDSTPTRSIQWDFSWPESAKEDDRHYLFSYLEIRFGINRDLFNDYLLLEKRKSWWLLKNSIFMISASRLKVQKAGIKAFVLIGDFIKPTTRLIQSFGYMATKAKLDLNECELRRLVAGEQLAVDMDLENGYVILLYNNCVLGLGLLINGMIRSQLPAKEIKVSMV